jgi:hypothetical protein
MKNCLFNGLSIKIIMEKTECEFIRDCFLDSDEDSEIFDDFFANLNNNDYNGLQTYGCEQTK